MSLQIYLFSFHMHYNLYVNSYGRDWYSETLLICSLKDEPDGSWDTLKVTESTNHKAFGPGC